MNHPKTHCLHKPIYVLADATLPHVIRAFPPPFHCHFFDSIESLKERLHEASLLIIRSTLTVNKALFSSKPSKLSVIATASSGIDHIDEPFLQSLGIDCLDAKGSNAHAVADYVLSSMAYLSLQKKMSIQSVGIVGAGSVGSVVFNRLKALGFHVRFFDPYVDAKEGKVETLDELLSSDALCIHANLHDTLPFPSRNLINEKALQKMKPGSVIIQASRGGIVSEKALLKHEKEIYYCTDVFENEPNISNDIVKYSVLCTPHIAGHSIEAKERAVTLLSEKAHAYFGLKPPAFEASPLIHHPQFSSNDSWMKQMLSLYDPSKETHAMKMGESFQALRKAHQFRHDFRLFNGLSDEMKRILSGDGPR